MAAGKKLHVLQFPWCAFGHIIPNFHLSIALAKAGVHVSFVSTPRNLQRLPKLPPPLASLITLVPIQLGGDLLPEGAEATVDLPLDKVPYLQKALDLAEPAFRSFVAGHPNPPDWFIVDFNATWICDVSRDFRIPILFFNVLSAGFLAFVEKVFGEGPTDVEKLTTPIQIGEFRSTVSFRRFEAVTMLSEFPVEDESGMSVRERVAKIHSACEAILLRACDESDGLYLNLYSKICGKKVVPLGLLPPEKPQKTELPADSPWKSTFEWLDKQNPRSVVFVGFGSEWRLTKDQVHEIARGVELSELPFLWSLRKPAWATEDSDAFPVGFLERTAERGITSMGWAPQMEILAHPTIGGCMFHVGWGSTIEALQFGHCLVVLPFIIDQPLNARFLVEKGFAIEVERNEDDGSFTGEAIAKALKGAMVSEEGEEIRKRAREAAAIFGDTELHRRYIEDFVQFLKNGDPNQLNGV
ncbi:putative UDP-rhamnose:rhamnosyltransferase 1 [Momordica charantia]|uniref:UDP-rhamnose:rhamnosyltransferase 1 n=1 Tax=Momordica charantia TaxID=3673 RepID=A0A6J1CZM3_MOMCH|nr:putative UDP-rhamnose:rhamnosyltransferase 1 [Momordica charantia]